MASQGPNACGTGTNVSTGVSTFVAWSNPGNITVNDSSYATAAMRANVSQTRQTRYLIASNFGFTIPVGATINGIVVEILRSATTTSKSPMDLLIQLTSDASNTGLAGDDKSSASVWPTTDAFATYGSSSDVWTFSPTVSKVNGSGFGVAIRGTIGSGGKTSVTMQVNFVRMTVYYTPAASGNVFRQSNLSGLGSGGPFFADPMGG